MHITYTSYLQWRGGIFLLSALVREESSITDDEGID